MARPAPDAPRHEHQDYANMNGYFWIPCLRCGKWWGGHEECRGRIYHDEIRSTATMTCCPDPPDGVESPGHEERQRQLDDALARMQRGERT